MSKQRFPSDLLEVAIPDFVSIADEDEIEATDTQLPIDDTPPLSAPGSDSIPEWIKNIPALAGMSSDKITEVAIIVNGQLRTYGRDATQLNNPVELTDYCDPFMYYSPLDQPDNAPGFREFNTGAVRDKTDGKGRYDLLPSRAIHLVAKHFELGADHYGDNNWRKGISLSVYLDSGLRHAFKHMMGMRDERHDVAAAWNFLALVETSERIMEGYLPIELDDLLDIAD